MSMKPELAGPEWPGGAGPIIDSHVHAFPYMGGRTGFASEKEHLSKIQRAACFSTNPARRKLDHSAVRDAGLWDGKDPSPAGLADVAFRAASYGRFEWTTAEGELYLQYFAPSLVDQISTADYLVAEMDYAGVTAGVIQNDPIYGYLNDFIADCVARNPSRFIGLGHVKEADAHTDEELAELDRCATTLGFRGLWYEVGGFWENGYREAVDDPKYDPFWEAVERLGLTVYWDPSPSAHPSATEYTTELGRMVRVLERHPSIPVVLVQAFPINYFAVDDRYRLPGVAHRLGEFPNFYLELTYPISHGGTMEYPYGSLWSFVAQLRDEFGPERLVWGSDMPNVLRFCTYRQSYTYLRGSTALSPTELQLLLGGNLARLFSFPSVERV
jgi:predicted TIM-barrel fold metal-dependent hydrolase